MSIRGGEDTFLYAGATGWNGRRSQISQRLNTDYQIVYLNRMRKIATVLWSCMSKIVKFQEPRNSLQTLCYRFCNFRLRNKAEHWIIIFTAFACMVSIEQWFRFYLLIHRCLHYLCFVLSIILLTLLILLPASWTNFKVTNFSLYEDNSILINCCCDIVIEVRLII